LPVHSHPLAPPPGDAVCPGQVGTRPKRAAVIAAEHSLAVGADWLENGYGIGCPIGTKIGGAQGSTGAQSRRVTCAKQPVSVGAGLPEQGDSGVVLPGLRVRATEHGTLSDGE